MSMSKRDYQAIARAIYDVREHGRRFRPGMWAETDIVSQAIALRLAGVLAADSPRFDRARFLEACETGKCKEMSR